MTVSPRLRQAVRRLLDKKMDLISLKFGFPFLFSISTHGNQQESRIQSVMKLFLGLFSITEHENLL